MGTVWRRNDWLQEPKDAGRSHASGGNALIDQEPLRWLKIAALAEATTLLLLIGVAVPLKHLGDLPMAVRILGPIHGFAYVAYLWLILQSLGAGVLSSRGAVRLFLGAHVPAAGYFMARFLTRRTSDALGRDARA